jgi:hypothetical protein
MAQQIAMYRGDDATFPPKRRRSWRLFRALHGPIRHDYCAPDDRPLAHVWKMALLVILNRKTLPWEREWH